MDLGLTGRHAIVCGGSSGLGKAVASALSAAGAEVLLVARTADRLETAAHEIQAATGNRVTWLAADVAVEAERKHIVARCPDTDILVNNAGGPPVGDFRALTRDDWIRALDANMLSAIDLINAYLDGMIERKFGRIVNITSHMVKAPVAMLSLSNGARSGLTGYVAGVAREVARHNVTLNNLLPGQFDTDRLRSNHERFASARGVAVEQMRERLLQDIPTRRFGTPTEFGACAAFLCSAHAGFIVGQNIMLDGGQFPGVL